MSVVATTSPEGVVSRSKTNDAGPLPRALHWRPFHRAALLAFVPPMLENWPPTIRSPFGIGSSASIGLTKKPSVGFTPLPSCDQDAPFHRATQFAATPLIVWKRPPATTSPFGIVARQLIGGRGPPRLTAPLPIEVHAVPFHAATCPTGMPPACVNAPAATRPPPGNAVSANTASLQPEASGSHVEPFQRAMCSPGPPLPALKSPPATRSPFGIASNARGVLLSPLPNVPHVCVVGSNHAMRFAATLPAAENEPPNASTGCRGPGPSLSHHVTAFTVPFVPASAVVTHDGAHCADAAPRNRAHTAGWSEAARGTRIRAF